MAWQPQVADMLACGCQTGHMMLVSPATGQLILTTIKHSAPVQRVEWIPGALLLLPCFCTSLSTDIGASASISASTSASVKSQHHAMSHMHHAAGLPMSS